MKKEIRGETEYANGRNSCYYSPFNLINNRIYNKRPKGFLFNNAYLLASEQERERLDKKSYYRQTAIVFLLLVILFALNAIEVFLNTGWIYYIVAVIVISTIIYAVVPGIRIESKD